LMKLTPAQHIAAQRRIIEFYGFHSPALELGLKWAEQHAPQNTRHTVVPGDFRAGNFIVGEEGIRLVLDWEIGQAGDPMQDLGWVCVKTWRFGGKRPVGGIGTRGVEEVGIERCAIGRRVEEPLWDFLNLIEGRD